MLPVVPSPITDYLPDDRDDFTAACGLCGFPLTKHQICADFSGHIVNYIEHVTVPCSFCLCSDCLHRLVEFTNGGPDEAYRRVYVSAILTRQAEEGNYNPFSTE